jgi:sugar lactone lactonase YvrE
MCGYSSLVFSRSGVRFGLVLRGIKKLLPLAILTLMFLFAGSTLPAQVPLIYTVAGSSQNTGYGGDGGSAPVAELNLPSKAVMDSAGNLYIADTGNNRIRKVAADTGEITTVAGTGFAGYSGDGDAATSAQLNRPTGVAVDHSGNLYICDTNNNRIREVAAKTGVITTYGGNGIAGYSGDGGAAIDASLYISGSGFNGIALDGAGNLYISDSQNARIRVIASGTGIITTVAGGGFSWGSAADGGPATNAIITNSGGIAVDNEGNIYFVEGFINEDVRKVSAASGLITTVAGGSNNVNRGDGGPATSAALGIFINDIAVDDVGNLYITSQAYSDVRKVTSATGIITTVAGDNVGFCSGFGGDGGPASDAKFCIPVGVSTDGGGNLYIADYSRIRKITASAVPPSAPTTMPEFSIAEGTYSSPQLVTITDAAPGASIYLTLDGTTPTSSSQGYFGPIDVTGPVTIKAIAIAQGYLQSDVASAAYTITSPPAAVISTVAGTGVQGFSGVGGAAIDAEIGNPMALALDGAGNLYFTDTLNSVVWMMNAKTGVITTVAGIGCVYPCGYSGDGGSALSAELNYPQGIAIDSAGNIYIADTNNYAIRKVTASTGIISTIAGTPGQPTNWGDGGAATSASLSNPKGMALDSTGNLYVADGNVVRRISASTGIIDIVAGNRNITIDSGDGGLATNAGLTATNSLTFDAAGNLYIGDNGSVRKVTASTGIITTVAGNGDQGSSGDDGLAINAEVSPSGLALDTAGNLYIADASAVRVVSASTGIITKWAGNGIAGFSGDGDSATTAEMMLASSGGIAFDAAGNHYIADTYNARIRNVVYPNWVAATPSFSVAPGTYTTAQTVTISDATAGASVYYTTDGSVPTTNSTIYTDPITVSSTETLQAIATASGYSTSDVATAAYTINLPAATPTFSVAAGTYTTTQTIAISDATAGATIYYTTNGTTPTTSSSVYSGPITVSSSETLEAIATASGYSTSQVATAAYAINLQAATPTFSVAAGTYTSAQTVTISDATAGATIYYTTNGTTPTTSSSVYSGPITVSSSETLEAIATASGYSTSPVASSAYTITLPAATPTFSLAAGPYTSSQTVTISDATAGATIYYTTNGTTPTTSSSVYSGPITVSSSETLEALATANGYSTSTVATAAYTINIPTNPVPVLGSLSPAFTDAGGADFTLTVSGSEFTAGSQIYWGTSALATQYVSATQLTAQVPATSIATAGITAITVETLTPGGGTSNSLQFEVDSAATGTTPPAFTSLTASVTAGSAATYPVTVPSTVTSVTATCLNLPTGASCSYSSTTNAVTITTSSTTPKGTYQVTVVFTQTMPGAATAGILLPILLLPLLFVRKKLAVRGVWFTACLGIILMAGAAFAIGCGGGGGSSSTPITPTNPTHQVTSSGAVSLTVQ